MMYGKWMFNIMVWGFLYHLCKQKFIWKKLMARKPWETELGSDLNWTSSKIYLLLDEELDKLSSASQSIISM